MKFKWLLIAALGLGQSSAWAAKLISVTVYNSGLVRISDGIADDGFTSPQGICYQGTELHEVCSLAEAAGKESRMAYGRNHGYFEIVSCQSDENPNFIRLEYSQSNDYDHGVPTSVHFRIARCL